MFSSSRSRRGILLALALIATSALAGCAPLASIFPRVGSGTSKPAVGDCWRSTYSAVTNDTSWTGGGPVGCAVSHQLFTYAIATVSSTAPTWGDGSGAIDDTINHDAVHACHVKFTSLIHLLPPDARLVEYFFIAPEASWNRGARWVRCDLGVYQAGSSFDHPTLATLPAQISVLVRQAKSTPDLFADCVVTSDPSGNTGPYDDPKATIADCTKNSYQWRMQNFFDLGLSDVYPSDDQISAVGELRCGKQAPSDNDWITYVPTEEQWSSGDHIGECWFYRDPAPQA